MSDEKKPPSAAGDPASPGSGESPAREEDFASLLEASLEAAPPRRRSFEVGQSVEGVIVALGRDAAFVDIGGKGEATMSLAELRDEEGALTAGVGDRVKALIVSTGPGLEISRKLSLGAAAREQIEAAFRSGLPVEGRVEKQNKGGYTVRLSGQRAFCPFSQIDIDRGADPEQHVGRVYTFRITAFKEGGRDLVLSRRVLLEEERREKAREILRAAVPGAVLTGRIASVTGYGAFVDLGAGVQGLLHVSEMGWTRVSGPEEVVQPGEEITVQVLAVEDEGRKISLSLKPLQADPWLKVQQGYRIGETREGRVTRLAEFGAFVELEPGIEALAHMSTFVEGGGDWKGQVPVGATCTFRIESIDIEKRRIGVALREARSPDEAAPPEADRGHETPQGRGLGSLADKLRDAMKRGEGDG